MYDDDDDVLNSGPSYHRAASGALLPISRSRVAQQSTATASTRTEEGRRHILANLSGPPSPARNLARLTGGRPWLVSIKLRNARMSLPKHNEFQFRGNRTHSRTKTRRRVGRAKKKERTSNEVSTTTGSFRGNRETLTRKVGQLKGSRVDTSSVREAIDPHSKSLQSCMQAKSECNYSYFGSMSNVKGQEHQPGGLPFLLDPKKAGLLYVPQ